MHYRYWKHTHPTVDAVQSRSRRGGGFLVEEPEGVRCLIHSRLLSENELRKYDLL